MRKIHPLVIVMGIEMLVFIGIAILISSQPDEEDFIIGEWVSISEPEWTFQFDKETGRKFRGIAFIHQFGNGKA